MYNPYGMQQGFGQPQNLQNFSTTYSQMPQQLQQFANPQYNAYFQTMPQMQAANLGTIPQMQQYQQQPGSMFPTAVSSQSTQHGQPTMQSLQHQMGMSMQQHAAAAGLSNVNSVANAAAHGMSGLSRLNDSSSGVSDAVDQQQQQHALAAAALQAVAAGRDLSGLGGGHHHHGHGVVMSGGHGAGDVHVSAPRGGGGPERATGSSKAHAAEHGAEKAARPARPKKEKPKKPSGTGEAKPRTSVFSRPCKISPALQNVVGGDMMTRSEVVSRMWKYVRDQNLLDPKQKQFAVCDEKLEQVIGEKRFRVFGMMKYLKLHIFDPASQAAAEAKAAKLAADAAAAGGNSIGASSSGIQQQLHQLHNNGIVDVTNGGALNGGVQFPPPIDQSSPSGGGGGGGGMHHSHSQRDLVAGALDLGGNGGNVKVEDDGSSPQDGGGLEDWNDEGGHQE